MALTQMEKKELILFISNMRKTGQPVAKALVYYADNIAKREEAKDTISEIVKKAMQGNKLEDMLLRYGVIDDFQYSILINAVDKNRAYDRILSLSKGKLESDKAYMKIFAQIFLPIIIVGYGMPYLVVTINNMIQSIKDVKEDFEPSGFVQSVIAFKDYFPVIATIALLAYVGLMLYYFLSYRYDLGGHYRLFKLKALQDSEMFFETITEMLSAGLKTYNVFDLLSKHAHPVSARDIFAEIRDALINNRDYARLFKKLGVNDFTIFVLLMGKEVGDVKKAFFDAYDSIKNYKEEKYAFYKEVYDFVAFLIMALVFLFAMTFIFFGTIDIAFM